MRRVVSHDRLLTGRTPGPLGPRVAEMAYEFEEPFVVDSTRAETRPGPLADAVAEAVDWYRSQPSS